MPDMRRRTPEPPAGAPEIQFKPGMANELLHELAPLLAEEGIDVNNIDVPDLDTLQQALSRAIERRNMAMFTPVGRARELAAVTMRLAAEAIADGDTTLAAGILDQAQPESPDDSAATVAGCTGLALGLLDQWLSGHDTSAPDGLAKLTRLPAGHWTGERAATDILTLARKRRAFASLDSLIARQGGQARPVRQRPRPRRRPPGLVTTRRHTPHRPGTHRHPLKPAGRQRAASHRRAPAENPQTAPQDAHRARHCHTAALAGQHAARPNSTRREHPGSAPTLHADGGSTPGNRPGRTGSHHADTNRAQDQSGCTRAARVPECQSQM